MSTAFDPQQGLVVVPVEITGPNGLVIVQLALDTGATHTMINTGMLVLLGYNPAQAPTFSEVTTGSSVEYVAQITVTRIAALGQARHNFSVLCHTLPPSAGVDGLLGLDFLRGRTLTVDFRGGQISLV